MSKNTSSLRPGMAFRGLYIHSLLGEGGMGAAYLASHPVLKIPFVIKTFKISASQDIFQEAHLAARVTSPFTVAVLDAGVENGLAFAVLRYVDGIDLGELLKSTRKVGQQIPAPLVARLMMNAATGLHAVHQAGVVHRDVKPANIFLRGDGTATIGDFGIATEVKQSRGKVVNAGTPDFMAPEQLQGEPIDRRTDIYSLGVTMHLLITGERPFVGKTIDEIHQAHIHQPYRPKATRDHDERYLFGMIERMLRKKPAERHPTAATVAKELAQIAPPVASYRRINQALFGVGPLTVRFMAGNLAFARADVIVSAGNWAMVMDVGVARALCHAGGNSIETEALTHAPAAMGDVLWTSAGQLNARWVAHAVAALAGAVCLQRCTLRVLLEAEARQAASVAFPALGTGVGRVPMELAAQLMLSAIRTFAELTPRYVERIDMVLYDQKAYQSWLDIVQSM